MSTSNINVNTIESIYPPYSIKNKLPISSELSEKITEWRNTVSNIVNGKDNRIISIVGPCSIHDPKAALEYAKYLVEMKKKFGDELFIIMRVYFEKPRTTIGWKGLINDPNLNDTFKINEGLEIARKLLIDINSMDIPVACEFLDVFTPQYYSDLVTWGAIGARTTESQLHRQLASGLSMPIGFKNGTGGSLDIAVDAVVSSNYSHCFLGINEDGKASIVTTKGNQNTHIILRGGKTGPNFDHVSIMHLKKIMKEKVKTKVIVDCSHGNSGKIHKNQPIVIETLMAQYDNGESMVAGVMIESNLKEGNQKLVSGCKLEDLEYGKSITDACVGLNDTTKMLKRMADSHNKRNPKKQKTTHNYDINDIKDMIRC
jgi:3-deoxy-7-phosphoheptulonate synthase